MSVGDSWWTLQNPIHILMDKWNFTFKTTYRLVINSRTYKHTTFTKKFVMDVGINKVLLL